MVSSIILIKKGLLKEEDLKAAASCSSSYLSSVSHLMELAPYQRKNH